MKKHLRILSLILLVAMALCFAACTPDAPATNTGAKTPSTQTGSVTNTDTQVTNKITITVDVVGSDGNTTTVTIQTDKTTLRGALEQENLVQGEESAYGLYVKTVNGETADYDVDGAYWAIYEGDVPAMTGVDGINITEGGHYKLVYTK